MPGSSDLSGQDYVTQVLRLDLEQMQMTTLFSYPAEALGVCGQGAYYVLDGQTLQGYSLTDGSKLSDVAVDNPGVQALYGVFDGRLLASGYTREGEPLCYALDVETGERPTCPISSVRMALWRLGRSWPRQGTALSVWPACRSTPLPTRPKAGRNPCGPPGCPLPMPWWTMRIFGRAAPCRPFPGRWNDGRNPLTDYQKAPAHAGVCRGFLCLATRQNDNPNA